MASIQYPTYSAGFAPDGIPSPSVAISPLDRRCHWCSTLENRNSVPFKACTICRGVLYCSAECQASSLPFHQGACKSNQQTRMIANKNPSLINAVLEFKRWHGYHIPTLCFAAISALELTVQPGNVNGKVLLLNAELKPNHLQLPLRLKYDITSGQVLTINSITELLGSYTGFYEIMDSWKRANRLMQGKGSLGVAMNIFKVHDTYDIVKVVLPSHSSAKAAQSQSDWGIHWAQCLRSAVEKDSSL